MAKLHKEGQSLSNAIPPWERFVVTEWCQTDVQAMLDKKWTHVAKQWEMLDIVFQDVTSVIGDVRFTTSFKATHSIVVEALAAGKKYIGAVSTCDLIVTQLPPLAKSFCGTKIGEFFTKARASGAILPENLVAFLQAEQRRAGKP